MDYPVANKKWSEERLWEKRREILSWWPTGAAISDLSALEEAAEYHKSLPESKVWFPRVQEARLKNETPLFIGMMGHATVEETSAHVKAVAEAGCDLAFIFTDTYTRKANYAQAQKLLDESRKQGKSLLNGCAIVSEGHLKARQIIEDNDIPCKLWDGADELPMLQFEMGIAAGFTSHGCEDLHDLYQHVKDYPLDKRIENDQYCCRLAAWYEEQGAIIDMWTPGNLMGYEPPDIKIAILILQALSTAEQGCRHLTCYINGVMNLIQDVASVKVCRKLIREYLDRFGYTDAQLNIEYGFWQGNWPMDRDRGAGVVGWNAAISALSGADAVLARGVAEGFGICTPEEGITTVKITKQIINMLRWQRLPEFEEIKLEEHMIELSVRAIVDRVIEMGEGDPVVGKMEAVKGGVLDDSFSGWKGTYGKVMPIRDAEGAVRWYDRGNLPLPKEVIEYQNKKLAEREKRLGRKLGVDILVQDLFCASVADLSRVSLG